VQVHFELDSVMECAKAPQHDCPWDNLCPIYAAQRGNAEMLAWIKVEPGKRLLKTPADALRRVATQIGWAGQTGIWLCSN
jgi:hypothetical protein